MDRNCDVFYASIVLIMEEILIWVHVWSIMVLNLLEYRYALFLQEGP